MAYFSDVSLITRLMFAGISIGLYLFFYLIFFGKDSVKWMIINSALGVIGIYAELQWVLLSLLEINISDYPSSVNAIPFIYYVMYNFLIYQMVLSISGSRINPKRKKIVEAFYIIISLALSLYIYLSA